MDKLWLPVIDPLGIIERLTEGNPLQLRDPLKVALKGGVNPFSVNPAWLPAEVREELLRSYGEYATKTAEAFAPVGDVATARTLARSFHQKTTEAMR